MQALSIESIQSTLTLLAEAIQPVRGATPPNPPVGAALLSEDGEVLGVGVHARAGLPHAEPLAIEACRRAGNLDRARRMIVTLEPCNHQGRTPPCTAAILKTPVQEVLFLHHDPFPHGPVNGASKLQASGVLCRRMGESEMTDPLRFEHARILGPFLRQAEARAKGKQLDRPWVTLKTVWRLLGQQDWTMVPEQGQTTFSSLPSLRLAHQLRRQADAILTGSGTILGDHPRFTVRHLDDHAADSQPVRWLAVLDRRGRVGEDYWNHARNLGFKRIESRDLDGALHECVQRGVSEVLVEAGPRLQGRYWIEAFGTPICGFAFLDRRTR